MGKVDFEKAKADIAQIVEIVKTVPDALQQRCFELLFEAAFSGKPPAAGKPEEDNEAAGEVIVAMAPTGFERLKNFNPPHSINSPGGQRAS